MNVKRGALKKRRLKSTKRSRTIRKIGWLSAGAIVIANMVGTGAFTTLGLQLQHLQNTGTILLIWVLGGLFSLFGAFSYAELGTRFPRSGGEYHFLSTIYHPFLGYLSGWISLTVGFAAAIALDAMAMGKYLEKYLSLPGHWLAILVIVVISMVHSSHIRQSSLFQNVFTFFKIAIIVVLIAGGFFISAEVDAFQWSPPMSEELFQPAFAVALIYVTYAFSGWNAAAYIVGEIKEPRRNLPRALIGGTLLVAVLFLLLQLAFLNQVDIEALRGKVEVGQIVAEAMFGTNWSKIISFFIAFLLIASIGAMIWVGPRVTRAMADDYKIWRFLAKDNANGIPVRAIWLQSAISIIMVLTSSFEQVLLYSGFILQLFTTLTVAGVLVARKRFTTLANTYRSPFFPWLQYAYIFFSIWILVFLLYDKPKESLFGMLNLIVGAVSFWWSRRFSERY